MMGGRDPKMTMGRHFGASYMLNVLGLANVRGCGVSSDLARLGEELTLRTDIPTRSAVERLLTTRDPL